MRLGVARPTDEHEPVRREVRVALIVRVDLGEVDPRVVCRARIGVHADLRDRDNVTTRRDVTALDGELERADDRVDDRSGRAAREDHDDGVGVAALFDLQIHRSGRDRGR